MYLAKSWVGDIAQSGHIDGRSFLSLLRDVVIIRLILSSIKLPRIFELLHTIVEVYRHSQSPLLPLSTHPFHGNELVAVNACGAEIRHTTLMFGRFGRLRTHSSEPYS